MVSADLWGGLGNQMFQIATATSLAIDNNDLTCFDITGHRLGLQGFQAIKYKDNIYCKITDKLLENYTTYIQSDNEYEIPYKNNIKLFGYFQSPKYFEHNSDKIKELFSMSKEIEYNLKSFMSKTNIENKITVSLNIRRGDYLEYKDIHPFVGISYINEAVSKFNNCYIYVISDDIKWCINNVKSNNNILYFVEEFEDYEQLYLMSLCDHNIISNSTFGWWGSYLNKNKNKIIIAPYIWYMGKTNPNIYTKNMTIIDNSNFINIDKINKNKIKLIDAFYGNKDVKHIIKNYKTTFTVSNSIFGDPLPYIHKYLNIIYEENDEIKNEIIKEGEICDIIFDYVSDTLKLINAFYGNKDVTDIISTIIKNNKLPFPVSNCVFGDPLPGKIKYLVIKYEELGEIKTESIKEGETCNIKFSCVSDNKIKLINAFYGPKDVTNKIFNNIKNNNINFIVSNDEFDGDPLIGVHKYLVVKYEELGEIKTESFKEGEMCILRSGDSKIKEVFNLFDYSFAHDVYSVAGVNSNFIKWNRNTILDDKLTFYSNGAISEIDKNITQKDLSYAILFESRAIENYNYLEKFVPKFKKFFTHNSEFLNKYDNCYWIPGGGIWIGGSYGKGLIKITEKSKLCSIVSSNKKMCPLHIFRLEVVEYLKQYFNYIDIFGLNNWKPICDSLENYMFSIVIENFQDELYFTEKIMNCFATGTIPIYLGAKDIGKKFNIDGIICFNTIEELDKIIPKLSKEFYDSKIDAIKDNFERVKQYRSLEDYVYTNYIKYKEYNMDFTFGIPTDGNNDKMINEIIDSIELQNIPNYEIIIVGNSKINRQNCKIIQFDETIKNKWITKKKNIITHEAKYENIVYLHDYIKFDDNWYLGQLMSGNDFNIRMDKIYNYYGTRFRDWCLNPHNNNFVYDITFDGNTRYLLLPYNVNNLSKYMYISGSYWISKKNIMIEFPLNENLLWGMSEDIEWSLRIREKYDFNMNINSSVSLLKLKDTIFEKTTKEQIEKINNEIKKSINSI